MYKIARINFDMCFMKTKVNIHKILCRNAGKGVHVFKMRSKKIIERQQEIISKINLTNQHEILADMVTPHWSRSYEEELAIKQQQCEDVISHVFHNVLAQSNLRIEKILGDIVRSPIRDAYRNKDEFSVWPGLDGDPKTVGFFVGSPAVGKVVCVPATHLKCIKESHKQIAQLYQDYIRMSPLAVSYQLYDGGFWRNIVIRSNNTGDHMAVIITNPRGFTPDLIAEQEGLLRDYFSERIPNLSLFHQSCQHVKCTREQAPFQHLSGRPHLTETMSGLQFQISPDSFFQLNTPAAELLLDVVFDLAKPKHFSTLLDLYCGTGAFSLLASEKVRGSIGIEEVSSAVQDAKHNALTNNIPNCKFIAGRVEEKLSRVLKDLDFSPQMVAIVNPGRGGAGEGVISLLRQNRNIRRVVYVSCRPDNPLTMKNFVQLCERVSSNSDPFYLRRAVPVDLFPYTSHCELVLSFDKISSRGEH